MNKLIALGLLTCAALAQAQQQGPPPGYPKDAPWPPLCGDKETPNNVPCFDTKSGKPIHTDSPNFVPSQPLTDQQRALLNGTQSEPIDVQKIFKDAAPATTSTRPPEKAQGASGFPGFGFPPVTTPPDPEPVYRRSQASDDQAQKKIADEKRQEYQSGQVIGSALGNAFSNAIWKKIC